MWIWIHWEPRHQALSLWSGSTDSKTLHYQRTNPQFSSVQLLSHVRLFVTPGTAACQASLSITNSQSSLKLMSIESVMPSSHLILCLPLLLLPPIRVFSNESTLHKRYRSFSFSIIPSKEHPGQISFRMDWLGLLAFSISVASRYSCLENSLDRGAWWATVQRATKNLKKLSDWVYTCTHTHAMQCSRPAGTGVKNGI